MTRYCPGSEITPQAFVRDENGSLSNADGDVSFFWRMGIAATAAQTRERLLRTRQLGVGISNGSRLPSAGAHDREWLAAFR
jgi:hypothetical protein